MDAQRYEARERARALARAAIARGDATGWFEQLYSAAARDSANVPWADREGHPLLREWIDRHGDSLRGRSALCVGCGLGEDAEALAAAGARVTAFDVSPTAIAWCAELWSGSSVRYVHADLLALPVEWRNAFDFVLEIYTLQALPPGVRAQATRAIAHAVAPGGRLLAISRGREPHEPLGELPWPLMRTELDAFCAHAMETLEFESLADAGDPPTRHWRALFERARDASLLR